MPFRYTKAFVIYRITQKISDIIWAMIGNDWKCILNCVLWFVSIILNLNTLSDTHAVQRHIVLHKSNRIFCII